jgi:hypothetical protein
MVETKPRPTLRIAPDKVGYVVALAREFDVKTADDGLMDQDEIARVLEESADDPALQELQAFLATLNDEELADLLALTWLGRGEWSIEDWDEIESEIKDVREQQTIEYLIGTPLLSDFLKEGLAQFGLTSDQGR